MTCEFAQHLIPYLDGELAEPRRQQVAAHLARCPRCADELAELRRTRSLLEHWVAPEPAPAARAQARRRLLRPQPSPARSLPQPTVPTWTRLLVRYALPLAAGVLVAVLVGISWERVRRTTVPEGVIAELSVLENLDILEAMDVLTEWDNLQALAALEPTSSNENAEEVTP